MTRRGARDARGRHDALAACSDSRLRPRPVTDGCGDRAAARRPPALARGTAARRARPPTRTTRPSPGSPTSPASRATCSARCSGTRKSARFENPFRDTLHFAFVIEVKGGRMTRVGAGATWRSRAPAGEARRCRRRSARRRLAGYVACLEPHLKAVAMAPAPADGALRARLQLRRPADRQARALSEPRSELVERRQSRSTCRTHEYCPCTARTHRGSRPRGRTRCSALGVV